MIAARHTPTSSNRRTLTPTRFPPIIREYSWPPLRWQTFLMFERQLTIPVHKLQNQNQSREGEEAIPSF